jgi:hypothetical protein
MRASIIDKPKDIWMHILDGTTMSRRENRRLRKGNSGRRKKFIKSWEEFRIF